MVNRVDSFAHVLPREFYDEMIEAHPTEELRALGNSAYFWDVETRLDDMDTFGIDRQVLTLARSSIWLGMEAADARPLVRAANDAVAAFAEEAPERFIPVGTLPFVDDAAVDEFDRCVDDLGMAGVQIFSNDAGKPIDSDAHRALYDRAERAGTPIWLHPQLHEWHEWIDDYMIHKALGWPFDTSVALMRLVYSGVMDAHPDLVVIPHHMGGMIPHFIDRLEFFYEMVSGDNEEYPYHFDANFEEPIDTYLRRFYADTARSGAPSVLEDGNEFFDNLVFSTDYPFGPDSGRAFMGAEVEAVDEMDVSEEERAAILHGNIGEVLPG